MSNKPVIYIEDVFKGIESKQDNRPNTQMYGKKIATRYLLRFDNKGHWHRVYAVCFSNVASHYVVIKSQKYFIKYTDTVR